MNSDSQMHNFATQNKNSDTFSDYRCTLLIIFYSIRQHVIKYIDRFVYILHARILHTFPKKLLLIIGSMEYAWIMQLGECIERGSCMYK